MAGSSITFYDRVEDALHNRQLQTALTISTSRFTNGRKVALQALPEADALRDHARRIRAHTIAHLDRYLGQFADSVERAGGQVHWAETADEANRIVAKLAQERNVKNVVKSKSMVSEELHLNAVLEAAEICVTETDLGEYIAQLA
ncbi:MAG: lactate utilization protein, partial [Anaerolineae bacterium]|nr:lactate utilization protein [Anaerolineae bacterium]